MEDLLIVLGTAVFCFALVRILFGFLAWLFPEADDLYRARLDAFFDRLDETPIFEVGRDVLQRLILPVRRFFARRLRAYAVVGLVSLVLNAAVFVAASAWVIGFYLWDESGLDAVLWAAGQADPLDVVGLVLLVGLLGAVFDLLSLAVTLYLLNKASLAKNAGALVEHLGIDVVIAAVSCLWAYAIFDIVLRLYYEQLVPFWAAYTDDQPEQYLRPTMWDTLQVSEQLWYGVIWLGISVSLPTLIYLAALLPVLALRIIPRAVQRGLSRVVYLISTDRQPVLKQVATFASTAGGLIGATIGWMRYVT